MSKTVYQLVVTGRDRVDSFHRIASTRVFGDIELAKQNMGEFVTAACGHGHLITDLVSEIKADIVKLILIQEETNESQSDVN